MTHAVMLGSSFVTLYLKFKPFQQFHSTWILPKVKVEDVM